MPPLLDTGREAYVAFVGSAEILVRPLPTWDVRRIWLLVFPPDEPCAPAAMHEA